MFIPRTDIDYQCRIQFKLALLRGCIANQELPENIFYHQFRQLFSYLR